MLFRALIAMMLSERPTNGDQGNRQGERRERGDPPRAVRGKVARLGGIPTSATLIERSADTGGAQLVIRLGMAAHKINLTIPRAIEIQHTDIELEVSSDGAKLGTLKISRGTIDWLPARNTVNYRELTWERFAELMEEHGIARQYE